MLPPHMPFVIPTIIKSYSTLSALKWFFASVLPHVTRNRGCVTKKLMTHWTWKSLQVFHRDMFHALEQNPKVCK